MIEMELPRAFLGIWIPRKLWLNRDLTPLQKMLIAEITSLSEGELGCRASNAYLANFFGVVEGRMANMLTQLRDLGVIETASFNGRERRLKVKAAFTDSVNPALTENDNPAFTDSVKSYLGERKEENKRQNKDSLFPDSINTSPTPKKRKGSGRATIEEVAAFCIELGLGGNDGEFLFHRNEAKEWPKNWQAQVRQWKSAGWFPSQKQPPAVGRFEKPKAKLSLAPSERRAMA